VIYLVDTHLLLWLSMRPTQLSVAARAVIDDPEVGLMFSAAAIWEVAIKFGLGRPDFTVDPRLLRRGLLDNGYVELAVDSAHAAEVAGLPTHHADPFDRIQIAQARVEGLALLTSDPEVSRYGSPVQLV
jgi:PIN domain nuclease of toxin-antitoxin system